MANLPSVQNWEQSISNIRFPSKIQVEKSTEKLNKYFESVQNDIIFSTKKPYENIDYTRYALKRVIARGCKFIDCLFTNTAGTGSIWSQSKFLGKSNFNKSNFEFADFTNCHFIGNKEENLEIVGASFSSSSMHDTVLENVKIEGCSFSQVDFSKTTISNCDISSSTFENAIFHGAELNDLSLSNLNIEYSDFSGAKFNNVEFSLVQFAYIFGIEADDIMNGNIKLTISEVGKSSILSVEELSNVSNDLVNYFLSKNNFFPVANLYLMFKREAEFKEIIEIAIRSTLLEKNYRELKFIVKLVYKSNYFNPVEKKALLELIETLQLEEKESHFKRSYLKHKSEIESYLLPSTKEEFLIEFIQNSKLNLETIQRIFEYYEQANLLLEWMDLFISQNSPIKFKVFLNKHKTKISIFLQFTAVVFSGISAINSFASDEKLTTEQKQIAIYVNNNYIQKMDIENFAVRQNSNYLIKYDEQKNIQVHKNYVSLIN